MTTSDTARPIDLDNRERRTLADALDAYRSLPHMEHHEWMRVPRSERLSPADLDDLTRDLLEG